MKLIAKVYEVLLQAFGLLERRCGWCKKFQGWKRGPRMHREYGYTTHGICPPCLVKFGAESDAVAEQVQRRVRGHPRRQRRSIQTLRRQMGGWGGEIANQQRGARG